MSDYKPSAASPEIMKACMEDANPLQAFIESTYKRISQQRIQRGYTSELPDNEKSQVAVMLLLGASFAFDAMMLNIQDSDDEEAGIDFTQKLFDSLESVREAIQVEASRAFLKSLMFPGSVTSH